MKYSLTKIYALKSFFYRFRWCSLYPICCAFVLDFKLAIPFHFFFLNFNAASTCGYAKYVFKTSLFPWGWPNQSQALNTGPKYSVIAREDANVESIWKKCVTILRKSLRLAKITYKENVEAQNIKACTDAQLNVVCVSWWNVICQISRVISRSIFQISFRAGRPW